MKEVYTKPKLNIIINADPQDDALNKNFIIQSGGDIVGGQESGGFDGELDE